MNKSAIFLICLFVITTRLFGQSKSERQLEKSLDATVRAALENAPGCAVLIARKGEIIYKKAFGSANLELSVAMQPNMVFRIGSVTKQFTAVAVLQQVEQGTIKLQDSIKRFLPDFPDGHTITIENLLTHTSGIIAYDALDAKIPFLYRMDIDPNRIIDTLRKQALQFTPGTKFQYSNSNYFLLGYILESVTGLSYREYLQKNILAPLRLTHTRYDDPKALIPYRVSGYSKDSNGFRNADYLSMSLVYAAGALVSNVEDLFQWHKALRTHRLLTPQTMLKAFTPYKLADGKTSEYGYGWFIKYFDGKKAIGHGGGIDGFRALDLYFPEEDILIITLFNSEHDDLMNLAPQLADVIIGKPQGEEFAVSDSVLNSYTGVYQHTDPKQNVRVRIYKRDGKLYADLSNGTGSNLLLVAQSPTPFVVPVIRRVKSTVDFVVENGKVTGQIWTQEAKHKFTKVE